MHLYGYSYHRLVIFSFQIDSSFFLHLDGGNQHSYLTLFNNRSYYQYNLIDNMHEHSCMFKFVVIWKTKFLRHLLFCRRVRNEIFRSDRGDREQAKNLMVIITDGASNDKVRSHPRIPPQPKLHWAFGEIYGALVLFFNIPTSHFIYQPLYHLAHDKSNSPISKRFNKPFSIWELRLLKLLKKERSIEGLGEIYKLPPPCSICPKPFLTRPILNIHFHFSPLWKLAFINSL